jgi:hypothetical protein
MAGENLATYLNDHLAGAVAAIEMVRHLELLYPDSPTARFLTALRHEIEHDRDEVLRLMGNLEISRSRSRRATAWIAGKFSETKLRLDDKARGALYWLESLEVVSLGIAGKVALWHSLNTAAMGNPALDGILDYRTLEQRAQEQREAIERLRRAAARAAFEDSSPRMTSAPMTTAQSAAAPSVSGHP